MATPTTRRTALTLLAAETAALTAVAAAATQGKTPTPSDTQRLCNRYYDAWNRKDLDAILTCVDPTVIFKSPNATTQGRDAYATAARKFLALVEHIEVRHLFPASDGAMAAVDFYCVQPIGICPTAERIALKNGLIVADELFFDPRPFEAFARAHAAQGKQ